MQQRSSISLLLCLQGLYFLHYTHADKGEDCDWVKLEGPLVPTQVGRIGKKYRTKDTYQGKPVFERASGETDYIYWKNRPPTWNIGKVLNGSVALAAFDNASHPANITSRWLYASTSGWVSNKDIRVVCSSEGIPTWAYVILGIGLFFVVMLLLGVGCYCYHKRLKAKTETQTFHGIVPDKFPPPPPPPTSRDRREEERASRKTGVQIHKLTVGVEREYPVDFE